MIPLRKMTPEEYAAVNLVGTERVPNRGVEGNQALVQALGDKLREIAGENATTQDANNDELVKSVANVDKKIAAHADSKSNPHAVTKAQVGLDSVDNTGDINKPVSTAQQAAINAVDNKIAAHSGRTDNPHAVTKSQVGLENVDNTSDVNKPVSTATALAITSAVSGYPSMAQVDAKDAATLQSSKIYTDQKVVDIGGADMQKAVYDPTGKNTDIFAYVDGQAAGPVSVHNASNASHPDIRVELAGKATNQGISDAITAHNESNAAHADMRADIAGKATPAAITAAITAHDAGTAHTAQFSTKVDKSGSTLTGPLIAGGTQTEATAQTRNSVILPAGTTDFSAVPNNTLIFVKEA